MQKILIICTGNSCRSQMAEAFLKSFEPKIFVYSAGTNPENLVSSYAVEVMKEIGIDISSYLTKSVDDFLKLGFNYVITVCDNAKESCPVFTGKVQKRLHFGFEDPAKATGTEEEILNKYRQVRDEIRDTFRKFYIDFIKDTYY